MTVKTKARRKNRPPLPSTADLGPGTAAQTRGTVVEAVPDDPNGSKRRRRQPPHLAKPWLTELSPRQHNAAVALWDAAGKAEATGGCAIPDMRVDGTPRYGDPVVASLIRSETLLGMLDAIPPDQRAPIRAIWCDGLALSDLAAGGRQAGEVKAQVKVGLDLLANRLRM